MSDITDELVDALRQFTSPGHLALCTHPDTCRYAQGARALARHAQEATDGR